MRHHRSWWTQDTNCHLVLKEISNHHYDYHKITSKPINWCDAVCWIFMGCWMTINEKSSNFVRKSTQKLSSLNRQMKICFGIIAKEGRFYTPGQLLSTWNANNETPWVMRNPRNKLPSCFERDLHCDYHKITSEPINCCDAVCWIFMGC